MVPASWAHISMYWASVTAIAGVFWPRKLVAIRLANSTRLAAITGGGTVMANAVSKAAAATWAWLAVCSARSDNELSHATKGVTAESIARDEGPIHGESVSSEIT